MIILTNRREKKKIWSFWYWPSWVGLQQRSFCPVLLLSIEGDWVQFRRKGKLYSLIREWRGESSGARVHALPEKLKHHQRGCSIGLLAAGRGRGSRREGAAALLKTPDHTQRRAQHLCTRPTTAILNWVSCALYTARWLDVYDSTLVLGTLVWRPSKRPCEQVKLD